MSNCVRERDYERDLEKGHRGTQHGFGLSPLDSSQSQSTLPNTNHTLSLGAPLGIPLYINWTSLLLILFFLMYYLNFLKEGYTGLGLGLIFVGSLFFCFSIICHEYGHGLTNRCLGADTRLIMINGGGGYALCSHNPSHIRRMAVSIMGPATHVVWMLLAFIIFSGLDRWDKWGPTTIYVDEPKAFGLFLLQSIWEWQAIALVINLWPWLPGNDASHILQTVLEWAQISPKTIYHVAWAVNVVCTGLLIYGYVTLFHSSVLTTLGYVFIMWLFFFQPEFQLYRGLGNYGNYPATNNPARVAPSILNRGYPNSSSDQEGKGTGGTARIVNGQIVRN